MQGLIERALSNPWAALGHVLDGPLHPGGVEHTEALLDRAGVGEGTRVLDVGCGPGHSVELARDRGAATVGVDLDPAADGVRGDLSTLPVRDGTVDVALAECVLCLVDDRRAAFGELRRVVRTDGRLALSDVVVEDEPPDLPDRVAGTFGVAGAPGRDRLVADVEAAGFAVEGVSDHRDGLLEMRDRVADAVDYESLLGLMGRRGADLLSSIEALESAVEAGRVGYVSLVATRG